MMNKMMVMMIAAALVIFLTAGCGSSRFSAARVKFKSLPASRKQSICLSFKDMPPIA